MTAHHFTFAEGQYATSCCGRALWSLNDGDSLVREPEASTCEADRDSYALAADVCVALSELASDRPTKTRRQAIAQRALSMATVLRSRAQDTLKVPAPAWTDEDEDLLTKAWAVRDSTRGSATDAEGDALALAQALQKRKGESYATTVCEHPDCGKPLPGARFEVRGHYYCSHEHLREDMARWQTGTPLGDSAATNATGGHYCSAECAENEHRPSARESNLALVIARAFDIKLPGASKHVTRGVYRAARAVMTHEDDQRTVGTDQLAQDQVADLLAREFYGYPHRQVSGSQQVATTEVAGRVLDLLMAPQSAQEPSTGPSGAEPATGQGQVHTRPPGATPGP